MTRSIIQDDWWWAVRKTQLLPSRCFYRQLRSQYVPSVCASCDWLSYYPRVCQIFTWQLPDNTCCYLSRSLWCPCLLGHHLIQQSIQSKRFDTLFRHGLKIHRYTPKNICRVYCAHRNLLDWQWLHFCFSFSLIKKSCFFVSAKQNWS